MIFGRNPIKNDYVRVPTPVEDGQIDGQTDGQIDGWISQKQ